MITEFCFVLSFVRSVDTLTCAWCVTSTVLIVATASTNLPDIAAVIGRPPTLSPTRSGGHLTHQKEVAPETEQATDSGPTTVLAQIHLTVMSHTTVRLEGGAVAKVQEKEQQAEVVAGI